MPKSKTLAQLGETPEPEERDFEFSQREGFAPRALLASLGQRYQDYPAASFAERFGPYYLPPDEQQREMLRQFMLEDQMRRDPNVIRPGTRTWPFGYTLI